MYLLSFVIISTNMWYYSYHINMNITAPISIGELFDKLSILEIKISKITDPVKLKNVKNEFDLLQAIASNYIINEELASNLKKLKEVNLELWEIEDEIRIYEMNKDFEDPFVDLARKVYLKNDLRFKIKSQINRILGSKIIEEKHLPAY